MDREEEVYIGLDEFYFSNDVNEKLIHECSPFAGKMIRPINKVRRINVNRSAFKRDELNEQAIFESTSLQRFVYVVYALSFILIILCLTRDFFI